MAVGVGVGVALTEAEGVGAGRLGDGVAETLGVDVPGGVLAVAEGGADDAGGPVVDATVGAVPAAQPASSTPADRSDTTPKVARRARRGVAGDRVFTRRHGASAPATRRGARRSGLKYPDVCRMRGRGVTGSG